MLAKMNNYGFKATSGPKLFDLIATLTFEYQIGLPYHN